MTGTRIDKLAYIGGGSSYTPEFVDGFIQHADEIRLGEIALMDIDQERLDIVGAMVERMLRHAGLDTRVHCTTERAPAIEGAQFVVSAIRVGGMDARIRDEQIPLRHGVIGQETTGPGGTLKAWRTIPVALDIARDVAQYAPSAWFINFTNPSGIITESIAKHSEVKVVGLCNNPINMRAGVAELLGVPTDDVFLEWVGLNHINWIQRVYSQGRDVTNGLIQMMAEFPEDSPLRIFDPELVRALGVIPTYYLQYYYYHARKLAEAKAAERSRGEVVSAIEADLMEKYAQPDTVEKPPELGKRGGALYSEAALRLILSLTFDRRDVQIVDTSNHGSIPDLADDAVVEVPCVVGSHGVTPLHMGRLPDTIRALCQAAQDWESWTVKAGVTGDRDSALMAMLVNPLVPGFPTARDLLDEMLEANKDFLPQFYPPGS